MHKYISRRKRIITPAERRVCSITSFAGLRGAAGMTYRDDFSGDVSRWTPPATASIAVVGGKLEVTQLVSQTMSGVVFFHQLQIGRRITVSCTRENPENSEHGVVVAGRYARKLVGGFQFPSGTNTPNQPTYSTAWRFELFPNNTIDFYAGGQLLVAGIVGVNNIVGVRQEGPVNIRSFDDWLIQYH